MEQERPYVMSFAGLDPSGGAGLLADIKTFEQHRVYGMGVCTAITIQTPNQFVSVEWLPVTHILAQAKPLLTACQLKYCKIGIVADLQSLLELVRQIKLLSPGIRIILDPVLKASAGYTFHNTIQLQSWKELLSEIYLLTPNYDEALLLAGGADGEAAARQLSDHCAVLLKGGHHKSKPGYDTLYTGDVIHTFEPVLRNVYPKHGSGCVLSAAVTAGLAQGQSLEEACANGKAYTEKLLASHSSLTGYHHL
ncbi:hydroxymethylpyrimidine/phosphomethylpyrimidine kinase [Chitinophaga sp. 22321]|uniref:hydroxymethylpyrimidine kinase n=1 Tax=Chitinophaga hostae TaxID=2831022 RepID=A0ABS5ISS1_9BACT|nr:hydroxymethylpyrimidine/phosphomethylpyrimidine kinase [Chitinophaga hostae]MBS0025984.1 hydroxymethylpyrimidine/phosphomethylpyrimidine kinase [Chitinophaga hostae]